MSVCVRVCWNLVLMRTRKRRGSQNNKVLIISAQHYGPGSYPHCRSGINIIGSGQITKQNKKNKKLFKVLLHAICIFIYYIIIFCNFSFYFWFFDFYGLNFVLGLHKCHKLRLAQFVGQLISFVCGTLAAGICIAWYVVYLSVRYSRVINYFASYKCIYSRVDAWDCVVGEGWQTKYQSHCR